MHSRNNTEDSDDFFAKFGKLIYEQTSAATISQGSILGLILFTIFVNDLSTKIAVLCNALMIHNLATVTL